jgi:hypothetical protein
VVYQVIKSVRGLQMFSNWFTNLFLLLVKPVISILSVMWWHFSFRTDRVKDLAVVVDGKFYFIKPFNHMFVYCHALMHLCHTLFITLFVLSWPLRFSASSWSKPQYVLVAWNDLTLAHSENFKLLKVRLQIDGMLKFVILLLSHLWLDPGTLIEVPLYFPELNNDNAVTSVLL